MDSKIEINELCRLCLAKEQVRIHIFEGEGYQDEIFLKISTCLPVNISYEDKLPKRICTNCSDKLDILSEFCNKSANSEKQLLDWFNQYGTGNDTSIDNNLDFEMEQCTSEIDIKEEVISFLTDEEDNYEIKTEQVDVDNPLEDIPQQINELSTEKINNNNITENSDEEVEVNFVPPPHSADVRYCLSTIRDGLRLKRALGNIVIPGLFFSHDTYFAFGSLVLKHNI